MFERNSSEQTLTTCDILKCGRVLRNFLGGFSAFVSYRLWRIFAIFDRKPCALGCRMRAALLFAFGNYGIWSLAVPLPQTNQNPEYPSLSPSCPLVWGRKSRVSGSGVVIRDNLYVELVGMAGDFRDRNVFATPPAIDSHFPFLDVSQAEQKISHKNLRLQRVRQKGTSHYGIGRNRDIDYWRRCSGGFAILCLSRSIKVPPSTCPDYTAYDKVTGNCHP